MKEKFFNNVVFAILTILLLVFSLNCFLIAFRVIQKDYLIHTINSNIMLIYANFTNQIVVASLGLLLFVIVLYLIWLKQKITQQLPSVKVITDEGVIKISTFSLSQIILNILQNEEGVKEIKPIIRLHKNGGIKITLQLIVSPNSNIPKIAQSIQEKLKEELPRRSGVEAKEIKINVEKIHDEYRENSK